MTPKAKNPLAPCACPPLVKKIVIGIAKIVAPCAPIAEPKRANVPSVSRSEFFYDKAGIIDQKAISLNE